MSRSPLVEHFVESINGAVTIRAFGYSTQFFDCMKRHLDTNIRLFLSLKASESWVSLYLELAADIFLVVMITFILAVSGYVSPGYAALATAYSFIIPDFIFWIVLQSADLEN
jgi:ABC-type bacteriocin/lantibiotic exporter with double-glycine peptidase domain